MDKSVRDNPLVLGKNSIPFPSFRPRWPWLGGDLQTLRNTLMRPEPDFSRYRQERLLLPLKDGSSDKLWAMLTRPSVDTGKPTVVLVHGLTGCETSRNIMVSAAYHLGRGYPVVRLNLRNAGPSLGHCSSHYHAGRSGDIRDALAALPENLTAQGILLVGVSLGGNVVLKFLAEREGTAQVRAAATVCAPIDLKAAQVQIGARRNTVYERYLLRFMKQDARIAARARGREIDGTLAQIRSVYDFDNLIVARDNGFDDAEDYYRRSSAAPLLDAIVTPTLLLQPRTDPWVPVGMYLRRTWSSDGPLTVVIPDDGGHVGFHDTGSKVPWHDRCIRAFFDAHSR